MSTSENFVSKFKRRLRSYLNYEKNVFNWGQA